MPDIWPRPSPRKPEACCCPRRCARSRFCGDRRKRALSSHRRAAWSRDQARRRRSASYWSSPSRSRRGRHRQERGSDPSRRKCPRSSHRGRRGYLWCASGRRRGRGSKRRSRPSRPERERPAHSRRWEDPPENGDSPSERGRRRPIRRASWRRRCNSGLQNRSSKDLPPPGRSEAARPSAGRR